MLTKGQVKEVTSAARNKYVSSLFVDTSLTGWSWTLRGVEKTPNRNGKWFQTTTFHILSVLQPDVEPTDQKYIKAKEKFDCKVKAAQALFGELRKNPQF